MKLTPALLLDAYRQGAFPMADGPGGAIGWYSPDPRAIQPFMPNDPLGSFRVRRSLAKRIRNSGLRVRTDHAFADVIHACAQPRPDGSGTWISPEIERVYTELHRLGFAHSVACYRDAELVGGLYGVAIGAAFFGESMFSREPNASQIAYAALIDRLRDRGYTLLDVQYINPHLLQFGVVQVPRRQYLMRLAKSVDQPCTWR